MGDAKPLGILCATFGEVTPFWERMETRESVMRGMHEFRTGTLAGSEVVVGCAGVGKVNAAMAAQMMVDAFDVRAIVNAGATGAVDSSLELFDIVITSDCVHHDVDDEVLVDSYPYYESPAFASDAALLEAAHRVSRSAEKEFVFGRTATGECFVDDSNRDAIVATCAPLAVDMETAAMAQTCHANGMPFLAVRCVTDTPALSGFDSYAANADEASALACDAVEALIASLNETL